MHKTKEDNLIEVGIDEGNDIFFQILEDYRELDKDDHRCDAVLFSIMTNCIVQLHMRGFSEKNLVNEVFTWCEKAREIMEEDDSSE